MIWKSNSSKQIRERVILAILDCNNRSAQGTNQNSTFHRTSSSGPVRQIINGFPPQVAREPTVGLQKMYCTVMFFDDPNLKPTTQTLAVARPLWCNCDSNAQFQRNVRSSGSLPKKKFLLVKIFVVVLEPFRNTFCNQRRKFHLCLDWIRSLVLIVLLGLLASLCRVTTPASPRLD